MSLNIWPMRDRESGGFRGFPSVCVCVLSRLALCVKCRQENGLRIIEEGEGGEGGGREKLTTRLSGVKRDREREKYNGEKREL